MWKEVNGYDYPVRVNEEGKVQRQNRHGEWVYLRPHLSKGRYMGFYLYKNGGPTSVSANRLVYEAFYGPAPQYARILNRDGNRLNFRPDNLELGQAKPKYIHTRPRIEQIAPDGSVLAVFDTMVQAGKATYCDPCTVSAHCRGIPADRFKTMGFSFRYEEVKA